MKKQARDPEKREAAERLFQALSGIDSKYLQECEASAAVSAPPNRKLLHFSKRAGTVAAAVLCATVLGVGFYAVQRADSDGSSAEIAELAVEQAEARAEDTAEEALPESGEPSGATSNEVTMDSAETELLEQPESEECDLTGVMQEYSQAKEEDAETSDGAAQKVQGGTSGGAQTEDAPVDESTYEEAHRYSDEVESIQAAISQAMADGELPFVTSSAIHENPVRITVTVNTTDAALLDQVKAFDPSGEIIEIVYSDAVPELE